MKKLILSSVFVLGAALAVSAQTTKSCDSEHGTKSCCQKGTNSTSVSTGTTNTTSTTTTTKSCCSKGGDSHTSTDNNNKNTTSTSASTILTTTKSEEANTNGEPK